MANITGTIGNDTLLGSDIEGDLIFALEGDDGVEGLDGNDTIVGGIGNDTMAGNLGDDLIFGNAGVDVLGGILGAGEGNDTVLGGQDNDGIIDDIGDNLLFGNLGDDFIGGGIGRDTIFGGKGTDTILGNGGNDVLFGDLGNDILFPCDVSVSQPGVGEMDTLSGGEGVNLFFLVNRSEAGAWLPFYIGRGNSDFALITDFKPATDKILVQRRDLTTLSNLTLDNLGAGVGIFHTANGQPDLVAFLPGKNASDLQLGIDIIGAQDVFPVQ
jgi:Ca2+-binding RTX toxin-like protein